jgi:hypothetical protein
MAEAMMRLMADEDLRKLLAVMALEVKANFSLEKMGGSWETPLSRGVG